MPASTMSTHEDQDRTLHSTARPDLDFSHVPRDLPPTEDEEPEETSETEDTERSQLQELLEKYAEREAKRPDGFGLGYLAIPESEEITPEEAKTWMREALPGLVHLLAQAEGNNGLLGFDVDSMVGACMAAIESDSPKRLFDGASDIDRPNYLAEILDLCALRDEVCEQVGCACESDLSHGFELLQEAASWRFAKLRQVEAAEQEADEGEGSAQSQDPEPRGEEDSEEPLGPEETESGHSWLFHLLPLPASGLVTPDDAQDWMSDELISLSTMLENVLTEASDSKARREVQALVLMDLVVMTRCCVEAVASGATQSVAHEEFDSEERIIEKLIELVSQERAVRPLGSGAHEIGFDLFQDELARRFKVREQGVIEKALAEAERAEETGGEA